MIVAMYFVNPNQGLRDLPNEDAETALVIFKDLSEEKGEGSTGRLKMKICHPNFHKPSHSLNNLD